MRATVGIPDRPTATGYSQQGSGDWGDYLEKAETRLIGRTLALLGYGTQFTEDVDVVDAPAETRDSEPQAGGGEQAAPSAPERKPTDPIPEKWAAALVQKSIDARMSGDDVRSYLNTTFGVDTIDDLTVGQSQRVGDYLNNAIKELTNDAG